MAGERQPTDEGRHRQNVNERCVEPGETVRQADIAGAALFGGRHQAGDTGKERVFAGRGDLHLEGSGKIECPSQHAFARPDRHGTSALGRGLISAHKFP